MTARGGGRTYARSTTLTAARQRIAVSEDAALGLALCETYVVPADLRNGLDGYVALTRADDLKWAMCLYREWTSLGTSSPLVA